MKIEIRRASNGTQYYFRIVSGSNVLAHSENYNQKASAVSAAESIKRNASGAPVVDLS